MTQIFNYTKDVQGTPSKALPFPARAYSVSLAAGASAALIIPNTSNYWYALIHTKMLEMFG